MGIQRRPACSAFRTCSSDDNLMLRVLTQPPLFTLPQLAVIGDDPHLAFAHYSLGTKCRVVRVGRRGNVVAIQKYV